MGVFEFWHSLKLLMSLPGSEEAVNRFLALMLPKVEDLDLSSIANSDSATIKRQCDEFIHEAGFPAGLLDHFCEFVHAKLWDELSQRLAVDPPTPPCPPSSSLVPDMLRFLLSRPETATIARRAAEFALSRVLKEMEEYERIPPRSASGLLSMVIQSMQADTKKPGYLRAAEARGVALNLSPEEVLRQDQERLQEAISR